MLQLYLIGLRYEWNFLLYCTTSIPCKVIVQCVIWCVASVFCIKALQSTLEM